MIDELRAPEDRISILIGKRGEILKRLRKDSKTLITVKNDLITIEGEPLNVWNAKRVIQAIIHGFRPDKAFSILDGKIYKSIDIMDYVPKNRIEVVKSRIIGKKGKTRNIIEKNTNANICIGERTIDVICGDEGIDTALQAIEMIIQGYSHRVVYGFLERGRNNG